ncbi:MAG: hypothetical protein P1U40_10550 [Coxiellaceae bacterium]|nr:hypothetical protein [Coxiellaceae bacterium]
MLRFRGFSLILSICSLVFFDPVYAAKPACEALQSNSGDVLFDISQPVDASGYQLHGKNLEGGNIQYGSNATCLYPRLQQVAGQFMLPVAYNRHEKPLIETHVKYRAIQFITPIGLKNLYIDVGSGMRRQNVSGLDPKVLKKGIYHWRVPVFAVGYAKNDVKQHAQSKQFMMVAGVERSNAIYTQQFYLFTQGKSDHTITEHPIHQAAIGEILPTNYAMNLQGYADTNWRAFGDPVITQGALGGFVRGDVQTFPGGPSLDYEVGHFILPTMKTPWTAPKKYQCHIKGKTVKGCIDVTMRSSLRFNAQKIRVAVTPTINIFAESGTAYRQVSPKNLPVTYGVYTKKLIPKGKLVFAQAGGSIAPIFGVGINDKIDKNTVISAHYYYLPIVENADRLMRRDLPAAKVYVIGESHLDGSKATFTHQQLLKELKKAYIQIEKNNPAVTSLLGPAFFEPLFKKIKLENIGKSLH